MNARFLTRLLTLACMAGAALSAVAQGDYPNKPIRTIIPLAAGSAVDNGARVLLQRMGTDLGQSFVLENIPGSAGLIGAERVAKAAPDGYTVGGFNDSVLTMVPNIYKANWDPLTDFAPISLVGTIEWGLVVKPDSPYQTVADFIKDAKANPGKLNYGSGGSGSPQHLAMAIFAQRTGINLTHVPYKGATPAAVATAAGEVDAAFQGLGTVTSLIAAGKLRLLAVSTPQRLPQYPNVPTVSESGLSDFFFNSWLALVAPKGTPAPIIDRLYSSMRRSLDDAETRKQLVGLGITIRGSTPSEFGSALKDQYALYRKVIQDNNIKAD
ncbi:Bug family tripartite tricarboxylate transporter substrate binding protein [Variovorax saccharolyticus]|uniref:Bug family tripartite tricarboxylate transporter substrate binding protein n=1 Tax=Variovorax saccharolyticus TaxID=3053516 RepID=UPI0025771D10|nr:tripartite tricarboxylate transporter substrate binding protein [Variovorax sp. J31P216]MDM0029965.1 tripartite tricarboxylate transporter substrate binding protein [Variovorax sp. J31P216]